MMTEENLTICFDANGVRYLVPEPLDDEFDELAALPDTDAFISKFGQYKVTRIFSINKRP